MNWNDLKKRSYVPYSGMQRACVVESREGRYFGGVRIENASFPLTISEYQAAIFSCLSEGDHPATLLIEPSQGAVPDVWTHTYNINVTVCTDLDQFTLVEATESEPVEFIARLKALQSYCRVDESDFPVSCLLKVGENRYVSGVNIELADWQLGLCAERIALAKARSMGFEDFMEIHITAAKGEFISPCGACRQVLVEHMPYERVSLYHPDGTLSEHTPAAFLPSFFNGKSITS